MIRTTLIEKREFREEYGFKADALIVFGDTDISIQRSELFDAIRKVLASRAELAVTDTLGREWKVFAERGKGEQPIVAIACGQQRHNLPDFTVLSPDSATRLRSLNETADDVNLPASARDVWRVILSERDLEDEEVDQFHSEFRDTPVHIVRSIRAEIEKAKSSVSSLIPPSRRYFERLIGEYDGSASIRDYAVGRGKNIMEELSEWRPYDGFLFSLFLSSHSALTAEISVERLEDKELIRAFDFIEKRGDVISQLGVIEVGLRILTKVPGIEPLIIRIIEKIRDDDVDSEMSEFRLHRLCTLVRSDQHVVGGGPGG